VYWFQRAAQAKMHLIPHSDTVEHGIFATRVPARPNPIGISFVRLLAVKGNVLRIAEVDILDGTPLLDITPNVPLIRYVSDLSLRLA
jgi:tRNA (Thr-GGU) A37 N-methylase